MTTPTCGRQYLQTPADLAANGIHLGDFLPGTTYGGFLAKAQEMSPYTEPQLGLAIKFKPGMHMLDETAYPIVPQEWDQFLADVATFCAETPKVYAVDGTRFTMPI